MATGAPKIKIYLLERGYAEESDNDVQFLENDELVPFSPKEKTLSSAVDLTGIVPVEGQPLTPIQYTAGPVTEALLETSSGSGYYQPETSGWPSRPSVSSDTGELIVNAGAAWWLKGVLGVKIYDDQAQAIDAAEYELTDLGVKFAVDFDVPSSMTIEFYAVEDDPSDRTQWALDGDTPYEGLNKSFNRVLVDIDDEPTIPVTPETVTVGETDYKPYIELPTAAEKVIGTYAYQQAVTKYWIADHNNWIEGHYNHNPDVFVGEYDYPGDQQDVGGVPVEPGFRPKFRPYGTYQIHHREGLIIFPEPIDPDSDDAKVTNIGGSPVKAWFAHLINVDNVNGVRLTYQGVIDGRHAFEQQGDLAGTTRLQSLNKGDGVDLSGLSITDRSGATFSVDISEAVTVQDVIDAVASAASTAGRDVTVSIEDQSLKVTDGNSGIASNLIVGENGGTSAADLGIDKSVASDAFTGDQVNWPETAYPAALGKRIIGRNDNYNPVNVYVDGTLAPQVTKVEQPEQLAVKLS